MRLLLKTQSAFVLAAALSGCSLGGLLGGGSKPPVSLVTLTPEAAEPAQIARTAAAGQAVTIATPSVARELSAVRVPVQVTPTDVQYVANLQLVDTPDSAVRESCRGDGPANDQSHSPRPEPDLVRSGHAGQRRAAALWL